MGSALSSKTPITRWAAADQMHVLAVGNLDRRMALENLFAGVDVTLANTVIAGGALWHDAAHNPIIADAMEITILLEDGVGHAWYRSTTDSRIYYATASDDYLRDWTVNPTPVLPAGTVFPYVFMVGTTYYLAAIYISDNLYLWSSTDKTTWTIQNGGNPILTHSATPTDWYYEMYNPAICVVDGTWHLLIEGKTSTSQFQIGYSSSTLAAGPNFNTSISAAPVLPDSFGTTTGGNPFIIHVPDSNALLVLFCSYGNTVNAVLRAASASLASDLTSPASWTSCPGFGHQVTGVHVADMAAVFSGGTKPWEMLLAYNYDQVSGYQAYSNCTLNEFYAACTSPLTQGNKGLIDTTGPIKCGALELGQFHDCVFKRDGIGIVRFGNGLLQGSLQLGGNVGAGLMLINDVTLPRISGPPSKTFYVGVTGVATGAHLNFSAAGNVGVGLGTTVAAEKLQIANAVAISNSTEGHTGRLTRRCAREAVTLSGATKSTTLNIPSGARLLAAQLCVNTAVTDDGGDDTWSAAFSGGSTTAIATGAAAAKQTKINLQIVDQITSDVTNITFTPNGGSFSTGVIEVLVYYEELTAMANAA